MSVLGMLEDLDDHGVVGSAPDSVFSIDFALGIEAVVRTQNDRVLVESIDMAEFGKAAVAVAFKNLVGHGVRSHGGVVENNPVAADGAWDFVAEDDNFGVADL